MLKDITLGQYYFADSVLHRLDPRVKLFGTVLYIVSLFVFKGLIGFVLATAFLIAMIGLSKVPVKMMLKGIKAIWILILITALCNLLFTPGDDLVALGIIHITHQGVFNAVFFSIRLIYLVLGTSVMTLTTTPNKLTDGLEKGLRCLTLIRVPVHEIAMMMSIALRFVPLLGEETDRIKKAQMARGADFEGGNIFKKAKSLIPLLVPLFVSAFHRATDLALAMEARCYHGGEGRTKMKPLKYESRDYVGYVVVVIYLLVMITIRVLENIGILNFSIR